MKDKNAELFNEIYREISAAVGVEAAERIHNMYKGQQITFPVHIYNSKLLKNRINEEYDGSNLRYLALKYDYSEKTLRRIIKKNRDTRD